MEKDNKDKAIDGAASNREFGDGFYGRKLAEFARKPARYVSDAKAPAVTVIVPTFNAAAAIDRCLESVKKQTLKNIELICVDDGSRDDTLNRVYNFSAPNIKTIVIPNGENRGQGRRRNEALKRATGAYVAFLDADDYFEDEKYLEKLYDNAVSGKYDIVLSSFSRLRDGKLHKNMIAQGEFTGIEAAQKFISRDFCTHAPWAKLYKREIAQNVEFVNYGYSQDVLYVFRSLILADSVLATDDLGYIYDNTNNSSWRPEKLTPRHFYSSIRLLSEFVVEYFRLYRAGVRLDPSRFLEIWRKEHGPRVVAFMGEKANAPTASHILRRFEFIYPFLMSLMASKIPDDFYFPGRRSRLDNTPVIDCEYVDKIKSDFDKFVLNGERRKDADQYIIVYSDQLSSGGLEKVAVQAGNILSENYKIFYVLDKPDQVGYTHKGEIVANNIFNPELLDLIAGARSILDFRFKERKAHFPFCAYAIRNFAEKYIATVHNSKTCQDYFEKLKTYLDGRPASSLKAVVCVSEAVKNTFSKLYGDFDGLTVLHNPLEFKKFSNKSFYPNPYGEYMLFLGRMNATRHKGIDIMFRAFARSSLRGKCKIVLASDKTFDRRTTHILEYYDLYDEIIAIPFTEDITPLLKNARFLCAPSRWEGFSLSLIESLACSTPVLTTRTGGAEEVVCHKYNGYFCDTGSVKSALEGMEWLYENGESLRKNCLPGVRWLDINLYAPKLLNLAK